MSIAGLYQDFAMTGEAVAVFSRSHEYEKCGCSVEIYTLPLSKITAGEDLTIRRRIGVRDDCPHGHQPGAKIVKGGRKPRHK